MCVHLVSEQAWLAEENTVTIGIDRPIKFVRLENGEGYRVLDIHQEKKIKIEEGRLGTAVAFRVQFARIGEVKLRIAVSPGCKESTHLPLEVRSPFCDGSFEVERREQVDELDELLKKNPLVWVWGGPWIGKTTLIRQLVKRRSGLETLELNRAISDRGILYLNIPRCFKNGRTLREGIAQCVEEWTGVGKGKETSNSQNIVSRFTRLIEAIRKWRSRFDPSNVLIIFDQLQEICGGPVGQREVVDLLAELLEVIKDNRWPVEILVADVLSPKARGASGIAAKPFRVKPFSDNEIVDYILKPQFPTGFSIYVLQESLRRDVAKGGIRTLCKVTGGHPWLVKEFLCHTKELYQAYSLAEREDGTVLRRLMHSLSVISEEKERVALELWSHYRQELLQEHIKTRLAEIVKQCPIGCGEMEGCQLPRQWRDSAREELTVISGLSECPLGGVWIVHAIKR